MEGEGGDEWQDNTPEVKGAPLTHWYKSGHVRSASSFHASYTARLLEPRTLTLRHYSENFQIR